MWYNILGVTLPNKPYKTTIFCGSFSWMMPNPYMKNGCFTISIHLKTGCLGFQAINNHLRKPQHTLGAYPRNP